MKERKGKGFGWGGVQVLDGVLRTWTSGGREGRRSEGGMENRLILGYAKAKAKAHS